MATVHRRSSTRSRRSRLGVALVAALAGVLLAAAPATASATTPSPTPSPSPAAPADPNGPPLDRPGPALTVAPLTIARAVRCTGNLRGPRSPILLIPGTTLTPDENFSWNYERAFRARDRAYCTVTLPNHAMSDIQTSAEYVVGAIRGMNVVAGKKITIVGFSQGGMIGRWALRFWPDTRTRVGEVIGLDPSNHGTLDAYPVCDNPTGCAPAFWQQQSRSAFTTALNSRAETFAGIDYTSIYTPTDEVVVPNLGPAPSSALTTGAGTKANISTFDVCPGHVAEHLSMGSSDAVGYALVVDALDHPGPASAARIPRTVCTLPFHEGVDPATFPARFSAYLAGTGYQVATYPHVPAEPPLRAYARG